MTITKPIISLVPGMMSLALLGETVKTIPKNWGPKGVKKIDHKKTIKGFTGIMIGVPMIKVVSTSVASL